MGQKSTWLKPLKKLNSIKNFRLAEPCEFTRRAFENNKLDIAQVEAISDLVNSETEAQRKQAIRQLNGELTTKTKKFSDMILKFSFSFLRIFKIS